MKQKHKKKNSPRLANAIREAVIFCCEKAGWFGDFHFSENVGTAIWLFRFKADKYDVLNRLCPGAQRAVVTFARGDIRHKKNHLKKFLELLLLLLAVLLFLKLNDPC